MSPIPTPPAEDAAAEPLPFIVAQAFTSRITSAGFPTQDVAMTLESRTVEYLQRHPIMDGLSDRRSFLYVAFGGERVQLDYGGGPRAFCTRLVASLARYGRMDDGRSAMEVLLAATKTSDLGPDDQKICEELIAEWRSRRSAPMDASTYSEQTARLEDAAPQVFLSYSHRDSAIMQQVLSILENGGLTVWIDEGLEPGTPSWQRAIEEMIHQTQCMVVILTPNAKASPWVNREITLAQLLGQRIFPVLASGNPMTAIHFGLIDVQYVDVRHNYTGVVSRILLPALARYLNVVDETHSDRTRLEPENTQTVQVATSAIAESGLPSLTLEFDIITVPANRFTLSETVNAETVDLPEFRITREPLSRAQFDWFADALVPNR